ncbi:MAG TPA: TadE/TadG family type IV pilus assembly protein [Stellaceae bacterium]|nr:TadE/TadG family type IV pilus assembly protein [Stellaceae bacterium]
MSLFHRILRDQRAAVALEMAFVTPPFLLILLSILDMGLMLATQSLMDGAAQDAARLIRTGQVYAAGNSISTFQNQLCSDMGPMMSTSTCQSSLIFDVQTFGTYGAVAFPACVRNANQAGGGTACNFTPGIGRQIVGVQITYAYPFIIPWVGACLSGGSCWAGYGTTNGGSTGTGTATLVSTVVFQNEPFL